MCVSEGREERGLCLTTNDTNIGTRDVRRFTLSFTVEGQFVHGQSNLHSPYPLRYLISEATTFGDIAINRS